MEAPGPTTALAFLLQAAVDLIVLEDQDRRTEGDTLSGRDLLKVMRRHPRLCLIPALVYTGHELGASEAWDLAITRSRVFHKAEGQGRLVAKVTRVLDLSARPAGPQRWWMMRRHRVVSEGVGSRPGTR